MEAPTKPKTEPLKVIGCKVIMRARVSSGAKAVGAVLLDHVNWHDFRCDPGIERLADLTGYSRSNVQAGIDQLESDGLIVVHVRGGRSGRNSYEFCWDEIRRRDAAMQDALFSGARRTRDQGEARPEIRAQTRVLNPKGEPGFASDRQTPPSKSNGSKGQARKEKERPWRGALRSLSPGDAAEAAALRRWSADLLVHFKCDLAAYQAIVDAVDEDLQRKITAAEIQRHGAGLQYILDHRDELLQPKAGGHG
jgi:hypothetical protein